MEINRKIHGEGKKISPNIHKLVVFLYNPPRNGSNRGSRDFKTTYSFRDIYNMEKVLETLNQFMIIKKDGTILPTPIRKAYYNGKLIVSNGQWI